MKVVWETLKIFALDGAQVKVSCTAVRVPVLRAHSEAITIETVLPVTTERARYVLHCNQIHIQMQ
jgi:aspartate-semialdehyde dehydrogenase